METHRFDDLTCALTHLLSRRGLFELFTAMPFVGGLATLRGEEIVANGRRKRHKKLHHGRHLAAQKKRKKEKTCTSQAQVCAGKCGVVTSSCKQRKQKVDCGPCACDPPCAVCYVCNETTQVCEPDPNQHGNACSARGQVNGAGISCDVCASGCPFTSVQAAIDSAAPGDTITVCPGTYRGSIMIGQDLTIIGAGQGAGPEATILQGSRSAPSRHPGVDGSVVTVNEGIVSLRQLRITGGHASGLGGGVLNQATLDLTDCTVTENSAAGWGGGGIFNDLKATLTGAGSTITHNIALHSGGGIVNNGGTVTLTDCVVSRNEARDGGGGGIVNAGSSLGNTVWLANLRLTSCKVSGNTAAHSGGGINSVGLGSPVTLDGCSVAGNRAGGGSGGIFANDSVLLVIGSSISANRAGGSSGGIHVRGDHGALTLDGSSVDGNEAGSSGGGIQSRSRLTLINGSTVTGNTAGIQGGGVENFGAISCAAAGSVIGNSPDQCVDVGGAGTGCNACN